MSPNSSNSRKAKNSFGRSVTEFQEISMAIGVRNVDSSTSQRLIPSMPVWYLMPSPGSKPGA